MIAGVVLPDRLAAARQKVTRALLGELSSEGHWTGELSSSALSTATAVTALRLVDSEAHAHLIERGLRWLSAHVNPDGGWGDTIRSRSNISTTALVWAAFAEERKLPASSPTSHEPHAALIQRAEQWLAAASGRPGEPLDAACLVRAIADRYGKDRTFSVPILVMCQLAGRFGENGWRFIPALPFELAALPQQLFGALQLPVVSYALPALIALGQVIHHHHPSANPLARGLRAFTRRRTLRKLDSLQPANGGFLEATPLTSFVTMSLAAMGERQHPVVCRGVNFLRASARPDGSWPIDTNLATWLTTLSIKALPETPSALAPEQRGTLRAWLLAQQGRTVHSYTRAAPGGWAWTDLPGGVPDADDTAGAMLALLALGLLDSPTRAAGAAGVEWLLNLQNGDGGVPTFCRGWGALPFDRSSPDLTAHALRAWSAWLPHLEKSLARRVHGAMPRALRYLARSQREDGSWVPLWFGNEHAPGDDNPTYGTALVLIALRELRARGFSIAPAMEERATAFLLSAQGEGGGWGGAPGCPPSVEETSLALEALALSPHVAARERGTTWLLEQIERGTWHVPTPLGFYFAKLWYFDRLYPLIFATGTLHRLS